LFAGGVKKAKGYVALYQGWAQLELRDGNYQHAKTLIAEALTRDKRNGAGWLIAAHIEAEIGNDGLQGLLLRRGIECAPNDAELYRTLGEFLVNRGKIDDVRIQCDLNEEVWFVRGVNCASNI
jgi:Tfp pilus assembly protein PilF